MAFSFSDFIGGIGDYFTGGDGLDMNDILQGISGVAGAYSALQGTQDSVTKPYMMPGQEAGYGQAIADSLAQYEQGPQQYYPGQTVAGLDPYLVQGQNDQLGTTDRLNQLATQGGESALRLAQGGAGLVGGFQLPDQVGFGLPQEYQDAIMNPIFDQLNNRVIPGLHTAATQQGAFGGSRMQQQKADAAEQATQAATNALIQGNLNARQQSIGQRAGDISAQLSGRQQDIGQLQNMNTAMMNGINAIGTNMNQQLFPGAVMQDIGKDRMSYEQSLINADKDRFDWNRNEANDYINRLFQRLSLAPTGGSVTQGQSGDWTDAFFGWNAGQNIYNNALGTSPNPGTTQPAGAINTTSTGTTA